jgi:hypothetical protein
MSAKIGTLKITSRAAIKKCVLLGFAPVEPLAAKQQQSNQPCNFPQTGELFLFGFHGHDSLLRISNPPCDPGIRPLSSVVFNHRFARLSL